MPARKELPLSEEQRAELLIVRDHTYQPYMREGAAALLKVADGQSVRQVALKRD